MRVAFRRPRDYDYNEETADSGSRLNAPLSRQSPARQEVNFRRQTQQSPEQAGLIVIPFNYSSGGALAQDHFRPGCRDPFHPGLTQC